MAKQYYCPTVGMKEREKIPRFYMRTAFSGSCTRSHTWNSTLPKIRCT